MKPLCLHIAHLFMQQETTWQNKFKSQSKGNYVVNEKAYSNSTIVSFVFCTFCFENNNFVDTLFSVPRLRRTHICLRYAYVSSAYKQIFRISIVFDAYRFFFSLSTNNSIKFKLICNIWNGTFNISINSKINRNLFTQFT